MRERVLRLFPQLCCELACAAFLGATAHAAQPVVHKVSSLPALTPLTMSTGGRIFASPTAIPNSFGATDFTYQWPGTYFRAAFRGTAVFFRIVKGDQILHIVVDGQAATPLVKPEASVYAIEGLSEGKHAISVLVATESQAGPNAFGGFAVPSGEKVLTPPRRRRQIEFIGDSHTVGYGNSSPKQDCTQDEVWATTDNSHAFGPLTASHYHADYQINAISGRGIVRNYNGTPADTLPQAYPYVLFDKLNPYTDPTWNPQVIVIALGTNDFSTPLNPSEKWKTRDQLHADVEASYLRFLQTLHANHPHAYLILWATGIANGEVESEAQKVVAQARAQGFTRLTFLPIDHLAFTGCHSHPSLPDHRAISSRLEQVIDSTPHIWDSK